jgi:hypothetical protein
MTKNEKGGLKGYNNEGNIFGRDKDAQEPEGERVCEPKEMLRHEYPDNLDAIPDEDVNLD